MRPIVLVLLVLLLAAAIYYAVRPGGGGGGPDRKGQARIDQGIPVEGPRSRIDPHGPASADKVSSPLRVTARLQGDAGTEAKLDVELSSSEAFAVVRVEAQRYDQGEVMESGWSQEVWSGELRPGAPQRFQCVVPIGAAPSARILVSAHTQGAGGARFGATDIVSLEKSSAGTEPKPSGGVVEYRGRVDSAGSRKGH